MLEIYVKFMNEIDSEELIGALEIIMEKFQDEIGPFAKQLTQQLVNKYKSLMSEENDYGDDLEERELAAAGCVTAIKRIIAAISQDKSGLAQLLPIIYPILAHSLTIDGLDSIEEGLECINLFVYHACSRETRIPIELWNLIPQMIFLVAGNGHENQGGFATEQL